MIDWFTGVFIASLLWAAMIGYIVKKFIELKRLAEREVEKLRA